MTRSRLAIPTFGIAFASVSASAFASAFIVMAFQAGCSASKPPAAPQPAAAAPAGTPDVPPEALAGNWLFEVKMGSRTLEGSLHFTNKNGVLTGTWTSAEGNEYELKDIRIKGADVSWTGDGPGGVSAASGTIDGTSMKGTMKRAARRRGDASNGNGSGSSGSGSSGDDAPPPSDSGDGSSRGSGRRGGRSGGGRRGGGSSGSITWSAFKSLPPASETAPAPAPTPGREN
jgi:hypothetical protein